MRVSAQDSQRQSLGWQVTSVWNRSCIDTTDNHLSLSACGSSSSIMPMLKLHTWLPGARLSYVHNVTLCSHAGQRRQLIITLARTIFIVSTFELPTTIFEHVEQLLKGAKVYTLQLERLCWELVL